jgi:hypothetical protein
MSSSAAHMVVIDFKWVAQKEEYMIVRMRDILVALKNVPYSTSKWSSLQDLFLAVYLNMHTFHS